jgi:hypothetical protein
MKTFSNILEIYFQDESYSAPLSDFGADSVEITFSDSLYLGRINPSYSYFFAIETPSQVTTELTFEGWNGTAWVELSIIDDTLGFKRSGFIQLDPNSVLEDIVHEGKEMKWVRITSSSLCIVKFKAINILFADDRDLKKEFFPISSADFRLGAPDFLLIHESVRDFIVQRFRNKGYSSELISAWDFIHIEEVRLAATFFALARIFNSVSDEPTDNWAVKAEHYTKHAEDALSLSFLSFFDGTVPTEKIGTTFSVSRMSR